MNIVGFEKNSFVDFPSNIASVVFTPGCNFNCWYCHNKEIINETEGTFDQNQILNFLKERVGFLDGVVVTGGEPTMQADLLEFIKSIKEIGLKVKLDTNGTNPKRVKDLIDNNLLDYIAMDIKAPFEKYNIITPINSGLIELIKQSVDIIKNSNIDYEFRTTFAPNLSVEDIKKIMDEIGEVKCYTLQAYRTPDFMKNTDKSIKHSESDFIQLKEYAKSLSNIKKFNLKNL